MLIPHAQSVAVEEAAQGDSHEVITDDGKEHCTYRRC